MSNEGTENAATGELSVIITTDFAKELPAAIAWNYENLKAELEKTLEPLRGLVLTKDDDGIKFAKAKRAYVNKLSKMINDAKVSTKKKFLAPYEDFEIKAKELIEICSKASSEFDVFVKDAEIEMKANKQKEISEYLAARVAEEFANDKDSRESPFWTTFAKADPRWLNATYKITTVKSEIDVKIDECKKSIENIEALFGGDPEVIEKARIEIKKDFDLARVVSAVKQYREEQDRIRKSEEALKARQAEEERIRQEAMEKARIKFEQDRKRELAEAATGATGEAVAAPAPAVKPVVVPPLPKVNPEETLDTYTLKFTGDDVREVFAALINNGIQCNCAVLTMTAKRSTFRDFRKIVDGIGGIQFKKV